MVKAESSSEGALRRDAAECLRVVAGMVQSAISEAAHSPEISLDADVPVRLLEVSQAVHRAAISLEGIALVDKEAFGEPCASCRSAREECLQSPVRGENSAAHEVREGVGDSPRSSTNTLDADPEAAAERQAITSRIFAAALELHAALGDIQEPVVAQRIESALEILDEAIRQLCVL
jgi:hypothetical protein